MNQINEEAIVLSRTNFGEADRILTVLSKSHGKLRLMAKGVRKVKSKLAGGIELFSVSHITYIVGKSDINTLISTRLKKHYGNISNNMDRTMFGYDVLKQIGRVTEDGAGEEYFEMLVSAMEGLDEHEVDLELIKLWLNLHLLKLDGHSPNLDSDANGNKLDENSKYTFNIEDMVFAVSTGGKYNSRHIKLLRLGINMTSPLKLKSISDANQVLSMCNQLVTAMLNQFIQ